MRLLPSILGRSVLSCTTSKSLNQKIWLPELKLFEFDKDALLSPTGWLTDSIINAVQKILRKRFPDVSGLQDTYWSWITV